MKLFYQKYSDHILDKRFNAENPLRRYVHRAQYGSVINQVGDNEKVLDVGCGEGVLSCLLAQKGIAVTGIDISEPNIYTAKNLARKMKLESQTRFIIGDAEHILLPDNSFDTVISCHVLEHLPDFDQGLRELFRLSRDKIIIALPSLLNLCSLVQVGQGSFWEKSWQSLFALPRGILKTFLHLGAEGVDEGYSGHQELSHVWRFPWKIRKKFSQSDYQIIHFEASTICLPYFSSLLPVISFLDHFKTRPLLRSFGYGTTVVLKKINHFKEYDGATQTI